MDTEKTICSICAWDRESAENRVFISAVDTVKFPTIGNVSKKRVAEMERRVILPHEKPGGGYYVGRRMENGKVSEHKQPEYRD